MTSRATPTAIRASDKIFCELFRMYFSAWLAAIYLRSCPVGLAVAGKTTDRMANRIIETTAHR